MTDTNLTQQKLRKAKPENWKHLKSYKSVANLEKALDIAKSLKEKVPDRNFLTEGGSGFSRTLVEKFTEVNAGTLLRNKKFYV